MRRLGLKSRPWLSLQWVVLPLMLLRSSGGGEAVCVPKSGCDVAYAFYKAQGNETLDSIGEKFQTTAEEILAVNPAMALDDRRNFLVANQPLYIPFSCECLRNELYQTFAYQVQRADDIESITSTVFEDLTQTNWVATWNGVADPNFILTGAEFKIPVKCFCGDPRVSLSYGLFLTYAISTSRGNNNLSSLALEFNTSEALLRSYNPRVNWNGSQSVQYAFIPVTDQADKYPPFSYGSYDAAVDEITSAGVLGWIAVGMGGALIFLGMLGVWRQCRQELQRRRRESMLLARKLKSVEADSPFTKADHEVKV